MSIYRVVLSRSELKSIPAKEQALLLLVTHMLNEVNALAKILAYSFNFDTSQLIVEQAQITQSFILAKLLAGKLYESWVAIQDSYLKTRLAQEYSPLLDKEASDALAHLKRYFGTKSLLNTIRNEFSFHYSLDNATSPALDEIPEDELVMYFHDNQGQCLFLFSEAAMNTTLIKKINADSFKAAADKLMAEVTLVAAHLNDFGQQLFIKILEKHLGNAVVKEWWETMNIEPTSKRSEISIPFFFNWAQ